jgi:threonylcarbamoyladenosine tRNA methylthiotransferase MtaB
MKKRKQELLHLAEKTAFRLREEFVGRTMSVLLENEEKDGLISGHTPNFLRVWVEKGAHQPNEMVFVELKENGPFGFLGRVVV